MQILGVGSPPSKIRGAVCEPAPQPGFALITWNPPRDPGKPLYTRVTVERRVPEAPTAWVLLFSALPGETQALVALPAEGIPVGPGDTLRVTAWSESGSSPGVELTACFGSPPARTEEGPASKETGTVVAGTAGRERTETRGGEQGAGARGGSLWRSLVGLETDYATKEMAEDAGGLVAVLSGEG